MSSIFVAVAAVLLAVGAISFLVVRLIQALVLYRLMRAVKDYPNIAMALALAAHGDPQDMVRFRDWVARSVEQHGWKKTDEDLAHLLGRLYPLGAMGASISDIRTDEPH